MVQRGSDWGEVNLIIAATLTALGFAAVGVMAYYATRAEKPGPRCPRCLNGVKAGAAVCRACRLELEWTTDDGGPLT